MSSASFIIEDSMSRPKIRRARLTPEQVQILNEVFENDQNPSMEVRMRLGDKLAMETKQISSWFQNKRQKVKSSSTAATTTISGPSSSLAPIQNNMNIPHSHSAADLDRAESYDEDLDEDEYKYEDARDRASSLSSVNSHFVPFSPPPPAHRSTTATTIYNYPTSMQSTFQLPPPPTVRPTTASSSSAKLEPVELVFRHSPSPSVASEADVKTSSMHPQRTSARARTARLLSGPMPLTTATTMTNGNLGVEQQFTRGHSRNSSSTSSYLSVPSSNPVAHHPHQPLTHSQAPSHHPTLSSASHHPLTHSNPTTTHTPSRKNKSRKRMEAWQREPLKELWKTTTRPSMELRQEIAEKYDMPVAKVTNWFRNLRQAVRKRGLAAVNAEQERDDHGDEHEHEEMEHEQDEEMEEHEPMPARGSYYHHPSSRSVQQQQLLHPHHLPPRHHHQSHHHSLPHHHAHEDEDSGSESDELVTPFQSPETRVEHSFGASPSPRFGNAQVQIQVQQHHVNAPMKMKQHQRESYEHQPADLEDAYLLLFFSGKGRIAKE